MPLPDVFLSYNRDDQATARRFAEAFEREGFDVWWDATLRSGEAYDEVTEKALREAKAIVVLWSKTSVVSRWVRAEATVGHRNKTLVPAMIEPCDRPVLFELTQTAELAHWTGDPKDAAWVAFLADVRRFVARERTPTEQEAPVAPTIPPRSVGAASIPGATNPPTGKTGAWRRYRRPAIIAALVATLALAGWGVWTMTTGSGARNVRTAVLTFAAPEGDAELRAFADGLTNEITDVTGQIGVATIARSQTNELQGAEALDRAARLGATFVLGGEVRREGDHLVASARFDDPRTGTLLWSQQFERPATEARALRLQVATQAVYVLQCAHEARRSRGGNISSASMAAYMRACALSSGGEGAPVELRDIMAKLIAAEPRFALAHVFFATNSAELADAESTSSAQRAELLKESRAAARRAIALDPRNGDAYAVLSNLEDPYGSGNYGPRERWMREGLRRDPSHSTLNTFYGNFLRSVGALQEATTYLERGVVGDPLSPYKTGNLAWALFIAGREPEARRILDGMAPKWPDTQVLWWNRFRVAFYGKRRGDTLQLLAQAPAEAQYSTEEVACWRATTIAFSPTSEAERAASTRKAVACAEAGFSDPWQTIQILGELGKADEAYAIVAKNMDDRYFYPGAFLVPAAASLRRDPRFMPLMHEIGLIDHWRTTDRWPDFCAEEGLPFECKAEAARLASAPRKT